MPHARSHDAEIYYEVRGQAGPEILLIRGFGGPMSTWNGVDVELSRDHRIIVFDNRGIGKSSVPKGLYSAAAMADDAAAVLSDCGVPAAHIAGVSLGGMIAQQLALRHPNRVRSLVLVATYPGNLVGVRLRRRGVMALAVSTFMPRSIRGRISGYATLSASTRRLRKELAKARATRIRDNKTSLKGLLGQAGAVFRHNIGDQISRINAPTLIIHGDSDNLIDCRNASIMRELLPGARLELWRGHGHDLITEAPERLADAIRGHVLEVCSMDVPIRQPKLYPFGVV